MPSPARKAKDTKGTARAGTRRSPASAQTGKLAQAEASYRQAREQQKATANILRAIATAQTSASAVFKAIAKSANELLAGHYASVLLRVNDTLELAAYTKTTKAGDAALEKLFPTKVTGQGAAGRAVLTRKPAWIADVETDPSYSAHFRAGARERGYRSLLCVPILSKGEAIGVINVARRQPGKFSAGEIALLGTFADQATIAIENARLFNETKEALERQTATGKILGSISASMADAQPVFDAIVESLRNLFATPYAVVALIHDGKAHLKAIAGEDRFTARVKAAYPWALDDPGMIAAKAVRERRVVQLSFASGTQEVPEKSAKLAQAGGYQSIIFAPLLRQGQAIGFIGAPRIESAPLDEKQVALIRSFADQAVIAIENARLFNETKDALERETASAEVLKVISGAMADVQPVLDAVAERAARLSNVMFSSLFLEEKGVLRRVAGVGARPPHAAQEIPVSRGMVNGRAFIEARTINVPDIVPLLETEYPDARINQQRLKFRSILGVPLIRDGKAIGALGVWRREVQPFTDQEIALLETFAAQAVIAIENVRLFNETKEALERQTATADILRVMSSSPTDVQPVFDVIVEQAVRLCGARFGRVYHYDGLINMVAGHGLSARGLGAVQRVFPRPASSDTIVGRVICSREPYLVHDIEKDASVPELSRKMITALGTRSQVTVPMLRSGRPSGAITIGWNEPNGFDERKIDLLKTFAAQAVIAIENVRLFNETKEALEQQKASADVLGAISSSIADTKPVFDKILQSCERLFAGKLVGINLLAKDGFVYSGAYQGPARDEFIKSFPVRLDQESATAQAIDERRVMHYPDVANGPGVPASTRRGCALTGIKACMFAPMLWEGRGMGSIFVGREHVGAFSEKEMALLKTFADQAAIAIENARLVNETREALEQQTATSEILKVISRSTTDVQPVFDTISRNARQLLGGSSAGLIVIEESQARMVAYATAPGAESYANALNAYPMALDVLARERPQFMDVLESGKPASMTDIEVEQAGKTELLSFAGSAGIRSNAVVPMMRAGRPIGLIVVNRREPHATTTDEFRLLETFAAQAVIAIENVRLFNETKEALEQQTAVSEVLRVISASPTNVEPVLQAVAERAMRICESKDARIFLIDGDVLRYVAGGGDVELGEGARTRPIDRGLVMGRAVIDRRPVHVDDLATAADEFPLGHQAHEKWGHRTTLAVPLLRDDKALGAILLRRAEVRPFAPQQIALLKTFADQAAIAIENVRLFNETKEALEQQTSTADILNVISRSPTDLTPVFESILDNATRLCEAQMGILGLWDGKLYRTGAHRGANAEFARWLADRGPFEPPRGGPLARMLESKQPVYVEDMRALEVYQQGAYVPKTTSDLGGARTYFVVPMLKDDRVVGGIAIYRSEVRPFAPKQIDLVRTFANQAVIAIENTRLFNDTKEALEQQRASGEVLSAISSSIADASPVFDKILEGCERLFQGQYMGIGLAGDDGYVNIVARRGLKATDDMADLPPIPATKDSGTGLAILERRIVHFADLPGARDVPPVLRRNAERVGLKSIIFAPMFWDDRVIGTIYVGRRVAGAFTEKQVALLRTFADQAVIAIQNARLFREIQEKSRQLEEASKHKSQFLASMSHELRTPLNAILGFNEMILGGIYGDVPGEMTEPLKDMATSGKHLLRLINNVLDLAKIEAGRMELALADYSVHDTVAGVHATLRPLAAEKGLEFMTEVPADVPLAHGDGGRITQCLMNLAGNSLKFTRQGRVAINVQQENGVLRYSVTDTGIGIPPDKIGSLFTEFKQTDATIASEFGGTGLGLSITKKFIEMHGGRIWVESEPGKGSAFIFEVPLRTGS